MEIVPDRKTFSVTVVVCTRDRPALLEQCLRALSLQTYPNFDVLVVDNGSTPVAPDVCRRWKATRVPAPIPGLTRARNIGARAARGDLVAFIDDDGVAEPGWLEAMVGDFRDPSIAAVSGRVRYMKAIAGTRVISEMESTEDPARPRGRFDANTRDWFALACFGGVGDGGNMAFRRSVFAAGLAFDERLGRGRKLECGDEHVVFAALIAAGYRIAHNPEAIVRHPCPSTPATEQARRFRDLRQSIAYLVFLWNEFPSHRGSIRRFLHKAVSKRLAPRNPNRSFAARLSRPRALMAALGGLVVYWCARREWSCDPALHREGQTGRRLPRIVLPAPGSR